jgi:chemotaxis protein methyltransferase CheR
MIELTDKEYNELTGYIQTKFGIHLGEQKKNLVKGRLQKIFMHRGFDSFPTYYEYLLKDGSGLADVELADAITTNHTFFMREPTHFDFYSKEVLPFLYKTVKDRDLRIWCAACSTGEEAYTLAMLTADFFSVKQEQWDTRLLATDISPEALEYARAGVYTDESYRSLPESWRRIYFSRYDLAHHQVRERMRAAVIFRNFNLMESVYPFKRKFHVIFCRNVMIYFDEPTIMRLARKFYDLLVPGGYLFIGHSEVLDRSSTSFHYVLPAIYRKE